MPILGEQMLRVTAKRGWPWKKGRWNRESSGLVERRKAKKLGIEAKTIRGKKATWRGREKKVK